MEGGAAQVRSDSAGSTESDTSFLPSTPSDLLSTTMGMMKYACLARVIYIAPWSKRIRGTASCSALAWLQSMPELCKLYLQANCCVYYKAYLI